MRSRHVSAILSHCLRLDFHRERPWLSTSFFNGFGERFRFTILRVTPWPSCQIFLNHPASGGYELNSLSVFTPVLLTWLMSARQGHFQRLKLVCLLGSSPGPFQQLIVFAAWTVSRYKRHAKLRASYKYVAHVTDSFHWQCDFSFFPFPNGAHMRVSGVKTARVNRGTWLCCIIRDRPVALLYSTINLNCCYLTVPERPVVFVSDNVVCANSQGLKRKLLGYKQIPLVNNFFIFGREQSKGSNRPAQYGKVSINPMSDVQM